MGFSNFWSIFEHPEIFFGGSLPTRQLHYSGSMPSGSRQPYLLIDYNNVFMKASLHDFGNVLINDVFIDRLWNAILSSGFKIRIIFDGAHNSERALIKIMRMHGKISSALKATTLDQSTFIDMQFDASLQVAKCIFNDLLADYEEQKIDVECITAEQEADTVIRRMCRELVDKKEAVCVFSGDASLFLGVPSAVYVLSPDRFFINDVGKIEGPCLTVGGVLAALNAFIFANYRFLNPAGSKLDSESLCLVAALLGGEEVRSTVDPACSPYQLVDVVSTFLFQRRVMMPSDPWFPSNPRLLISACVLVLAWRQHLCIFKDVAPHEVPNPVRYVRHLSTLLTGVVKALGDALRGNNTSPRIFSISKLNPDGIYKLSSGVLNQINEVAVMRRIAKRLDEIMDLCNNNCSSSSISSSSSSATAVKGSPMVLYKAIWPVYTATFEPVEENTEEILHPFISYIKQLSRWTSASAAVAAAVVVVKEQQRGVSAQRDLIQPPIDTTSAEAFNTWMQSQCPSSPSKLTNSKSITYRYWKASIVRNPSRKEKEGVTQLDRFDAHSLSASILNTGAFPASGCIAADGSGRVLAWEVRPDAQSVRDDQCNPTYPWESSSSSACGGSGPLLDLRVRYLTLRRGTAVAGLLSVFGVNAELGQHLLGSVTSFWTTAYRMQSRKGMMHRSVESLLAAPGIGASTVVVLLQIIATCWLSKLTGEGAEDLKAFIADALVEALTLSPLFAMGLFCRMEQDSLSNITAATQCFRAWSNRWNQLLVLSKNSLSSAPVGNLMDARWTEVVDLILSELIDHIPASLSHLGGNMIAFSGWFDATGVCTVLRLKSATNKSVLDVDAMRQELGIISSGYSIAVLSDLMMTIKGNCRALLDDLMNSFQPSQKYGRPTHKDKNKNSINSNSKLNSSELIPDLSAQMQRLQMEDA